MPDRNFGNPGFVHRPLAETPQSYAQLAEETEWREWVAAWHRIWQPTKYIFGGLALFAVASVAIAYIFAATGGS